MSLFSNRKDQQQQPLFYDDEFAQTDLKVRLNRKERSSELSLSDLLVSGFFRRQIPNMNEDVPMLIVSITSSLLNESQHLPHLMASLIPMDTIFNKECMDLKTPKVIHPHASPSLYTNPQPKPKTVYSCIACITHCASNISSMAIEYKERCGRITKIHAIISHIKRKSGTLWCRWMFLAKTSDAVSSRD